MNVFFFLASLATAGVLPCDFMLKNGLKLTVIALISKKSS